MIKYNFNALSGKFDEVESPTVYRQLTLPTLTKDQVAIWIKTDAYNRVFLIYAKEVGVTYIEELDPYQPSPPYDPSIIETFETNWFINNTFTSIFSEDFETDWFIDNLFTLLFTEKFEGGW